MTTKAPARSRSRSALGLGATGEGAALSLWWQSEEKVIERAIALARKRPYLRKKLEDGLKRKRGRQDKHSEALRMQVLDTVEWLRAKTPRQTFEECWADASNYLSTPLEWEQVRGIFLRAKKAST